MRIAFYAPMKAPDHPVPSGDRTMARALLEALRRSGHEVAQPSRLRSFLSTPDAAAQQRLAVEAEAEANRIAADWGGSAPPDLWFTYHNHYKAPDLLGPQLARRFGLPYAIAEASHAPKRAGLWGAWHAGAEVASRAADLHLCFTMRDRLGLTPLLAPGTRVMDLPPFLDLAIDAPAQLGEKSEIPRLVTVAMMRPGDKLASYRLLGEALGQIAELPWHLDVIGDGPARDDVVACFARLPGGRVTLHGMLERAEGWGRVAGADLFVWPGFGEAYGLAYLEAQAAGVPVLALDVAGVSAVVRQGITGLLVAEPSPTAYATALRGLMADHRLLSRMGLAARRFVEEDRSMEAASARIDAALRACLDRKASHRG